MLQKLLILAAAAAMSVAAQSAAGRLLASVPFPFEVNGKAMPAGKYELVRPPQGRSVVIRNRVDSGVRVAVLAGEAAYRRESSELVFRKYGTRYFLGEIKYAGRNVAMQMAVTGNERELARTARPERVVTYAD
jgi:hypothetical protein